ncbi:hypothetical protein ACEPAG_2616 [Sanghuangporus baumii]
MHQLLTYFVAISLAILVAAAPLVQVREPNVRLPFKRFFNISGTTLPDIDRARAAHLKELVKTPSKRQSSFSVTSEAVTYVASVGVGSPPTTYSLIIDTGSSNTWVGAGSAFVTTSTSVNTGRSVSVTYGSGSFSGTEYTDTVTLSSDLVITGQGVGVASRSSGFDGVDGILGIGPTDLTEGTVSGVSSVPTVTDNLFAQGTISEKVVGVFFAPTNTLETTNGELTFGGADSSRISGSISYASFTSTSPAAFYIGIDESITYGSATGSTVLSSTAGIVDTGTTLLLIATDAFNRYVSLTGAVQDNATGLLRISSANYANLRSLFLNVGGTSYEFTSNAQTWPRALNTAIGGSSNNIYLIVADLGSNSGEGLDFINGYVFLERYYSVYDTTNNRVGFAATSNTFSTVN